MSPITLRYDGAYCKVLNAERELHPFLKFALSYRDQSLAYNKYYKGPTEFSCYQNGKFPTGLLPRAIETITELGYSYVLQDELPRFQPQPLELPKWFYPTQIKLVEAMWRYERGIASSPTGSGKTIAIGHYLRAYPDQHILITVPTVTLMTKTAEVLAETLNEEIGTVGSGGSNWQRVTVGLVKSLTNSKNLPYLNLVRVCVRDEAHGTGCETHALLGALLTNCRVHWGVSATPWRSDGKDMVMEGVLGPLRVQITAQEVASFKITLKPEYYQVPIKCPPFKVAKGKEKPELSKIYTHCLTEFKERNELIAEFAATYLKGKQSNKGPLLILVKLIEHGQTIQKLIKDNHQLDIPFVSGRSSAQERQSALDNLRNGNLNGLIASSIFNEGEDIKPLRVLILASGGGNKRIFTQQIGRVLRTAPKKDKALIIDFKDIEPHYLSRHSTWRKGFIEEHYPENAKETTASELIKLLG